MEYFEDLEDPRADRGKRHQLLDIIVITLCAVICGADNWVHIAMFGRSKEEWFRTFLELPNGIPSHDTFGDVFARLNPERFQECFMAWAAFGGPGGGATGSGDGHHGAAPLLHQQPGCLGRTDAGRRTGPLEYRELPALEPGCNLP